MRFWSHEAGGKRIHGEVVEWEEPEPGDGGGGVGEGWGVR